MGNIIEMTKAAGLRAQALIKRSALARRMGVGFAGKRDYYGIFGWDQSITPQMILEKYNRGGIARRVIHAYPDAVWARPPEVYVAGPAGNEVQPEWSKAWEELCAKTDLWTALYRLDLLSRLGQYSILLMGTDKPNLAQQLRSPKELNFLQPYGDFSTKIKTWNTDTTSKDFGMPLTYEVYPEDMTTGTTKSPVITAQLQRRPFQVHASRVIHVSQGTLEDQVYGVPAYVPIWNYLADLEKVVGSSSESYWMTAYRGLVANVDKDMDLDENDAKDLSDEIDEYQHGLRRFMRTRGVDVKSLGSDVADPSGAFNVLVTLISGTTGIPKRILLGSEAGQLASTQDKANWAERIEEYRALNAEPFILWPLVHRLIAMGLLPQVAAGGQLTALWPDAYRMSPLERGQTAAQTARTAANIVKARKDDPNLFSREEARAIIGLSTDNQVLAIDPKI